MRGKEQSLVSISFGFLLKVIYSKITPTCLSSVLLQGHTAQRKRQHSMWQWPLRSDLKGIKNILMTVSIACYMVTHNHLSLTVKNQHIWQAYSFMPVDMKKTGFLLLFLKHDYVYFSQVKEHLSDTASPWGDSQKHLPLFWGM